MLRRKSGDDKYTSRVIGAWHRDVSGADHDSLDAYGGFGSPARVSVKDFAGECAAHLKENGVEFDYIFIGYLGSVEAVEQVRNFLGFYPEAQVLLDPIMADHGKYYSNFDETYMKAMQKVLGCSHLLTPNYTESCFLAELPADTLCTKEKLAQIGERLTALGAGEIVITSVPFGDTGMAIALYQEGSTEIIEVEHSGRMYPGTGDLFAAVLQGCRIHGYSLRESALKAHEFVKACIEESDAYGYPVREGVLLEKKLPILLTIV